ncbi:MAG: hypothetical protein KJ063_24135 [Anaerolineae bacterium]|nr:hypothetical protein [Anaerolineae bacterium]
MDALKLPDQLQGPWHNALILTYGLDIPFFESALWPQFAASCRNKIILADGHHYLEACANYAKSGMVRHMNQRYVVEGIFSPRAAHAKLILLTNPERGRLLVGSGNLNLSGYASPGEMFTQYEYEPEQPEAWPAFQTVIELVKGLMDAGYIGETAMRHIHLLLDKTPWLYHAVSRSMRPIRHNLTTSFLEQLAEAVAGEPVEEMWVLSPFYDEEALALETLLQRLRPRQVTVLVQPGYTSVKPEALARVLDAAAGQVRTFQHREERSTYFHTKLYLLKLPDKAICLQGSPNLSQVAMLWPVPQGNIELANLLIGARDHFDPLLDALQIEPATLDINSLELSFQSDTDSHKPKSSAWRLLGGEWQGQQLRLRFAGIMPNLDNGQLILDGVTFPVDILSQTEHLLTLFLSLEMASLLQRPIPLILQGQDGEQTVNSNPIFVCNQTSLNAMINTQGGNEKLERVGDLDLDDEDLERLIGELDAFMVIDRQSVWQVAGRRPPSVPNHDADDEALRLDYADIDYEMLRHHPRFRQYAAAGSAASSSVQTRLQLILRSITSHFQDLLLPDPSRSLSATILLTGDSEAQIEEEREEEEVEQQRRQRSRDQRLRQIFKNFIRRYLRGIRSRDFQELAGYEVIAHNVVIFSHLLWVLSQKDWFEPEGKFIVESLVQTWRFFWGTGDRPGYFQQLNETEQKDVLAWVRQYHADAQLIAALFHCGRLSQTPPWHELRFELRDFWRYFLQMQPFPLNEAMLEETWYWVSDLIRYQPPRPTQIVAELLHLAHFETEKSFLRAFETKNGFASGSCYFERAKVWREGFDEAVTVRCLSIRSDEALQNKTSAISLLQDWMLFEPLDYYRLACPDAQKPQRLSFYEVTNKIGTYFDKANIEPESLDHVPMAEREWHGSLTLVQQFAKSLDEQMTLSAVESIRV